MLRADLTLESNTFLLSPANLVSNRTNFSLELVIGSVLLVKKESEVLDLFAEGVGGDGILIVSIVVVVILHKLLILEVTVLLLDSIELISESEVVLVSLLNLKDFGFELRDEEIFLITG